MTDTTEKKPVILQILPRLETGGVERGTVEIASALKEAGWTSIVVSGGGAMVHDLERLGTEHITLSVYSKNPLIMRKNAYILAKIIREKGVDVIHARSRAPAWSAKWAAQMTGIPFLTSFHGAYNMGPFRIKRPYNRVMTQSRRIIAVSNFIKKHILENYQVPEEKIRVIHRGVDIERFDAAKVTPDRMIALAKKWRIPEDLPVVMLPGRLTRWKGQKVMLDALAQMKHRNLRCLFVGSDQGRTGYRRELEHKIKKLKLESIVQMVDHCSEMDAAYLLTDIVVSASTDPEAFGRVVPEAQAMGRIVIGTNHGGATETIQDGVTGFLIPPNDPQALAEALDKVLDMPAAAREEMARRSIESVRNDFSKARMCARTLEVYRDLIREASESASAKSAD
jgi:glycosyltransferase involved in cell wall biosynthesis